MNEEALFGRPLQLGEREGASRPNSTIFQVHFGFECSPHFEARLREIPSDLMRKRLAIPHDRASGG